MADPSSTRLPPLDDDLLGVPLVADRLLERVVAELNRARPPLDTTDRVAVDALLDAVAKQRGPLVERVAASVREQFREQRRQREQLGQPRAPGLPDAAETAAPAWRRPSAAGSDPARRAPAVVDDDEVAADVDLSRLIDAVRDGLAATARAHGDGLASTRAADDGADAGPYSADVFARALWHGAQTLALPAGVQRLLLHRAAAPLTHALRESRAAAGRRADPAPSAAPATAARADPATAAQAAVQLLDQLFERLLADRALGADVRALLAPLQPTARRLVRTEDLLLEDEAHPMWRFIDEAAHRVGMHAPGSPGRARLLRHVEKLVGPLTRAVAPDAATFRHALGALAADDRAMFEVRLREAADDIAALQLMEEQLGEPGLAVPTGLGPLDVGHLETVPASLLDELAPRPDAVAARSVFVDACTPGDWVHLFSRGRWVAAQLLWQGPRHDVWLFGRDQGPTTLALRRRALDRLRAAGLLGPLPVRSLVRAAATQLMRDAGAPH